GIGAGEGAASAPFTDIGLQQGNVRRGRDGGRSDEAGRKHETCQCYGTGQRSKSGHGAMPPDVKTSPPGEFMPVLITKTAHFCAVYLQQNERSPTASESRLKITVERSLSQALSGSRPKRRCAWPSAG